MVEWDRDPEMAKWFDWTTTVEKDEAHLDHCRAVIRGWHEDYVAGRRAAFFVRDATSSAPLGSAELSFPEPTRAEASYSTREHRGRGFATRALRLLCRWGSEVPGVERIHLTSDFANTASRRVAAKVGFIEVAGTPGP